MGIRPGDIDDDGDVDSFDIEYFVSALLGTNVSPIHRARSDLNGDGSADGADMPGFIAVFMRG
jgi:hypothetical protein